MKKFLILMLMLTFVSIAQADPMTPAEVASIKDGEVSLAKINVSKLAVEDAGIKWNNGIGYSVADNKIIALSTVDILRKNGFALSVGWGGDADSLDSRAVAQLTYEIANLQKFGIETPILKYVNISIGAYAGYGRINFKELGESEFDFGPSIIQKITF